MTAPLTTRTDPAAIAFCQSMRRRAIDHLESCDQRALEAIRRDPSISHGRPESATIGEKTAQGRLTCTATFGPVTTGGEQTYHTRFALEGRPVSVLDAERIVMGLEAEGAE